ncbi:uncharacterized protein LOC134443683 [Engraulis encrasicolus]|uniref:uncharacterized protein LOC134443683 n=1 Tax=Engraulis encrasicolus TaxID=184585 RepID=UPI002FD5E58B
MLYDCRTDVLIPGITLWNHDELQKNIDETQQPNSEFNITASDSIDEKSNSLNVSGSLKLSLLGGLVNVAGSAKYFQDTKKSHKQQRLTLQYKTTIKHEQLTMAHLGRGQVSHPNVFEEDTATHVVTAILYGASAYFVFDRQSSYDEDKKQVEGEAKIMMDKLTFLMKKAEAPFNIDEKEKSAVEQFNCTFHGDFHLPSNPSTFIEAVQVYGQLPKKLRENGEDAVPVKVWLYPLVKLDSKAAKLQRDISNRLITQSSEVIELLNKTEMRCNDLLNDSSATTFPAMEKKLQTFMQNCRHYKLEFMQKLGSVLPSIRGGGQEENALEDILKTHERSPFNSGDLDQWLTQKGKESDTIRSFLKQMEKLGVNLDEKLDDLLSNSSIRNIVSFSFTSLDQPDSSLVKQSNFLTAGMMSASPDSDVLENRTTEWLSADTRQSMRRQLQLFEELKKLANSDDTKFIVASKYDERYPGACIFIYEHGSEPVPFIPPAKPATPTTSDVSCDGLTVRISEPDSATVEYRAEFKRKRETEWKTLPLQKNVQTITLSGLKPDTKYEIRATAVGKLGYSVSSDAITVVTAKPTTSPPTDLKVKEEKANSITLTWSNPKHCEPVKQYIVAYKEDNGSHWQRKETKTEMYTFTLRKLKPNTTYSIRMCTGAGKEESKPGGEIKAKTKKELLDMKRFIPLSGTPKAYLLKMTNASSGQFNKRVFGHASSHNPTNKTIMLVGATGSGKTTLINGMINYLLGVDWEDNWRFKLIDEETNKSQAHSQTSEVTAYQIHPSDKFQVPYSLTIIDTPGFGDTRGIKQDKKITGRIAEFFSHNDGLDSIDAVCFVMQAALARLTHTQKYIFEAILSVFGKNIANNIITLVTFADGNRPPVLDAIKEANIACATQSDGSPVHFEFNNSVLFVNNSGGSSNDGDFDYMFWKMGKTSMGKFFTTLAQMETQSLTLTKEVLEERKRLEATVEGLQPLIRQGLSNMEEIRSTQAVLDRHKTEIEENKDFEYEVEVEKPERINIPPGTFITNCHGCNFTCHYPCYIPNDADKAGCSAMLNGSCTVCPGKCVWSVHHNMTYRWDIKRVTEKKTYQELKSKYAKAMGEKMNQEQIVTKLEEERCQVQGKVLEMMEIVTTSLKRLKEIALRPDPLATPDYIDLMIQSEEQ